jgi:hypothetical protein
MLLLTMHQRMRCAVLFAAANCVPRMQCSACPGPAFVGIVPAVLYAGPALGGINLSQQLSTPPTFRVAMGNNISSGNLFSDQPEFTGDFGGLTVSPTRSSSVIISRDPSGQFISNTEVTQNKNRYIARAAFPDGIDIAVLRNAQLTMDDQGATLAATKTWADPTQGPEEYRASEVRVAHSCVSVKATGIIGNVSVQASTNVSLKASRGVSVQAGTDVTLQASDGVSVQAGADVSLKANGGASLQAGTDVSLKASKNIDMAATKNIDMSAMGNINMYPKAIFAIDTSSTAFTVDTTSVVMSLNDPNASPAAAGGRKLTGAEGKRSV